LYGRGVYHNVPGDVEVERERSDFNSNCSHKPLDRATGRLA